MRALLALFCIAALLYVPAAGAQETTGRVRGILFEAAPGVLVDASMMRSASAARWLDVELDGDVPLSRKRQLVLLPRGMEASLGDRVALRLGEPKSTQLAGVLPAVASNRALAVNPQAPKFADNASSVAAPR
ncbi:MAG: hypothetical protein ACM30H_14470 [Clostridia bacterium]